MQVLACAVQNYDWGKLGSESTVGHLGEHNTGKPAEPSTPYAELWMGTHPSGPSKLPEGKGLREHILENPAQLLGVEVLERFGPDLPFLFKVLSVAKALSIQAHPDKELAKKLHATRPDIYKDGNHKPEMAIALSEFEALVGFVDSKTLADALQAYPELCAAVGEAEAAACAAACAGDAEADAVALRGAFTALMTRDAAVARTLRLVGPLVDSLAARLASEALSTPLSPREALVVRLQREYPGDVGVLASYFLNYLTLQPGEGVFLAANIPHAYLAGAPEVGVTLGQMETAHGIILLTRCGRCPIDGLTAAGECVEVMATSDNVVRAGLTPKLRDTDTLCAMLTYQQGAPQVLRGEADPPAGENSQAAGVLRRYEPPFEEFAVDSGRVAAGAELPFPETAGPSVVIVVKGSARVACVPGAAAAAAGVKGEERDAPAGTVVFLPAHCAAAATGAGEGESLVFRARVNPRGLVKA